MGLTRSPPQSSANLQVPPSRRIALPVSERLNSITENSNEARRAAVRGRPAVPLPARVNGASNNGQNRWSMGASSVNTGRTAPPAYEWVPEPIPGEDDDNGPVEGEKLAELRRKGPYYYKPPKKGGWGRIALVVGIIALLAIALGVGLGVGLTRNKHSDNDQSGGGAGHNSTSQQDEPFPLGEYSFITALRTTNTNCTSNPATWRCSPYIPYTQDANASIAAFNWIIANTSATYASNTTTTSTPDAGLPANLTISSTNPLSISFTNESLTYHSSPNNSTSARYTFTFSSHKAVIPLTSITTDDSSSECFFNQTTFQGTLYLKAPSQMAQTSSSGDAGHTPWPYAIEILQTSPGGEGIPTCYQYTNGDVGAEITPGPQAEGADTQCSCEYRNF